MSLRLRLLIAGHRLLVKPAVARAEDPVTLRALFERVAPRLFRPPPFTAITDLVLAPGLAALRIAARPGSHAPRPRKVILYFHGGAFVLGSPRTHTALLGRLAWMTRTEVIAPFWRLAPEHPFPAGPDDARAAFAGLIARGYRAEDIVLGGDSAGGNIALSLLAELLAESIRPAGLIALSPVTDLSFSGASITRNSDRDPMLPAEERGQVGRFYLQGADPRDPRASPLFAAFPNPPPVFLQVAQTEILRDDSLRLAEKLRASGGTVTLDLWPDAPHVFTFFERWVPEARTALGRAAEFVTGLWEAQAKAGATASR